MTARTNGKTARIELVRTRETRKSYAYEPADGKLTGDAPIHSALYFDRELLDAHGIGESIVVTVSNSK